MNREALMKLLATLAVWPEAVDLFTYEGKDALIDYIRNGVKPEPLEVETKTFTQNLD